MTKQERIPASIPLAELNKEIAQECRDKARNLIECADIIEGKEPTNDKYDLLKEFVEWEAKQYKDLYYMYDEEIDNKKDCIDYFWWCLGRRAGIGEIRQSLKTAVEKFLEEAKDDERTDNRLDKR